MTRVGKRRTSNVVVRSTRALTSRCFSVPYSALSSTLLLIEQTSARLEIIRILSNFFRSVVCLSPDDLIHCVYLCVNKLAPEYEGIELGIGETIIMKAIGDSTGRTVEQLKADYKSKGDLGLVAEVTGGRAVRCVFTCPI
jgi:DNA ligase 1